MEAPSHQRCYLWLKAVRREEPKVRFAFIAEQQDIYPVVTPCKVMKVSRSGFYSYLKRSEREPTEREKETTMLITAIKVIYEESKKRYGSPCIHAELKRRGYVCSLARVKRLMRQEGIYAIPERKCKSHKTSLHSPRQLICLYPNLISSRQTRSGIRKLPLLRRLRVGFT